MAAANHGNATTTLASSHSTHRARGLTLVTSNRLEILADRLAQAVRAPLASPLQPEIIVVQSQGMARWLNLELARRHGVCANGRFPFPKAFGHEIFRAVMPEVPEESPFDRDVITWQIMRRLPALLDEADFASLRHYLADHGDHRKRFQLAQKIAGLFDQYLIFRPDLVRAWDEGRDTTAEFGAASRWQAALWREIADGFTSPHPAALQRELFARLAGPGVEAALCRSAFRFSVSRRCHHFTSRCSPRSPGTRR